MGAFDFVSDLFNSNKQPDPVMPDPAQPGMDALPGLPTAPSSYRTNVLEPQGGSGDLNPFALVGRMMGMPTTAERGGMVNQMAQQELAKRVEQGMPIDKAIMDFIQSPKGSAWMGSGVADVPGVMKTFADSMLTRPPVQSPALSPGQQATQTTQSGPNAGSQTISAPHAPMAAGPNTTVIPNPTQPNQGAITTPSAPTVVPPENTLYPKPDQLPQGGQTAPPAQKVVGPASVLTPPVNPQGQQAAGATGVQPEHVQTFNEMTRLANLPESTLRELATMAAMTPEGRMGRPIQLAVAAMREAGQITPEQANRFLAGSAQILENKTGYGPKFFFYDKLDGPAGGVKPLIPNSNYQPSGPLAPQMPTPGQGESLSKSGAVGPAGPQPQGGTGYPVQGTQPAGSNTPTQPAPTSPGGAQSPTLQADIAARANPPSGIPSDIPSTAYKPDGSIDWSKAGPRASMFMGVGPGANFTDLQTRIASMMLGKAPDSVGTMGRFIEGARSQMRNFQQVVMTMAKEGNQMSVPKDLTDHVKNLVEGMNLFDDPVASAIQMKTLSNRLTSEIKGNMAALANEDYASQDQQKIWEHQINMYRQVLRTMPSPEDTDAFIKDYDAGKVRASAASDVKNAFTNSMEIVDSMRIGGISPGAESAAKSIASAANSKELMDTWEKATAKLTPAEKNRLSPLMANRAKEIMGNTKNGLAPGEQREVAPTKEEQRVPTKTSPGTESDASKAINRNKKGDSVERSPAQVVNDRFPAENPPNPSVVKTTSFKNERTGAQVGPGSAVTKATTYNADGTSTPQETTQPAPQPKAPTASTPAGPIKQPDTPNARVDEGFTPFSRAVPTQDEDTGSGSNSFAPLEPPRGSLQDFMRQNVRSIENGPRGAKITFGRASGASKNKPTPFARVM